MLYKARVALRGNGCEKSVKTALQDPLGKTACAGFLRIGTKLNTTTMKIMNERL